jgi:hypothetical protein
MNYNITPSDFSKIHFRFKQFDNWVVAGKRTVCNEVATTITASGEVKPDKTPYDPKTFSPYNPIFTSRAKADDKKTWSTYDDAIDVFSNGYFNFIGFEMRGTPFVGIDIDQTQCLKKCAEIKDLKERQEKEAEIEETTAVLVEEARNAGVYVETTQSGGYHIIFTGQIPSSAARRRSILTYGKQALFEIYDGRDSRYYIMTGRDATGDPGIRLQEFLEHFLNKYFTIEKPVNNHRQPRLNSTEGLEGLSESEKARKALKFIDPDSFYENWLNIGFALRSLPDGLQIWDDWSRGGGKYKAGECQRKWLSSSFHKSNAIGLGTLFQLAKENGYSPPKLSSKPSNNVYTIKQIEPIEPPVKISAFPTIPPFEKFSQLTEIIINSAPKKQPELAVANLLAAIGVLLGGKVSTPTDLRTNLYFCAVVGPGRGKDHSRKFAQRLFRLLELEKFCSLKLGTGAGVVKLMDTNPPSKLFMHDEFGLFLRMVGNERTSAPWREINEVLNDFFSAANDVYHSTATKGGGVVVIREPCLGIYATSTPDEFYAGLTKTMLSSGMLSRVIFIRGNENATIELEPQPVAIPKKLLGHLRNIANMPYEYKADPISGIKIQCAKRIEFEPAAKQFWNEFRLRMDTLVLKSDQKFASIFARAGEHVAKIALILSSFELGETISIEAVRWATLYVENAINLLIEALDEHMAENLNEENAKRVLALIKRKGGSITKSELVRNTKWLDKLFRDNLLNSLIEGKELILDETPLQGSSKKTSTYILSVNKR